MNRLILILLALFCVSCSSNSLRKFGTEQQFQLKKFYLKGNNVVGIGYENINYIKDSSNNCFDLNDNREVITVMSNNLDIAIKHFYFRTVSFNVKKVVSNGNQLIEATSNQETDLDLEVAYCTFLSKGFLNNPENTYASFRLKR